MIPYAKDRFSKENERKFAFTVSDYQNNWEYYYIQYSKVLNFLLGIANEKHYLINCQHRSFMFIFRHTVELMLKYVVNEKGIVEASSSSSDNSIIVLDDIIEPI